MNFPKDWALLKFVFDAYRAKSKFKGYSPSEVTVTSVLGWLGQFPANARKPLIKLLFATKFYGENAVVKALMNGHDRILSNLAKDGIGLANIIYLQHDEAGSSSGVMLNLLRDAAQLQQKKAILLDCRSREEINRITDKLQTGAIIYVDDFSGTGDQFLKNRAETSQYIVGAFSEFFLSVAVCEEAMVEMQLNRVVPIANDIHDIRSRPLREESSMLTSEERSLLLDMGTQIFSEAAMGYKRMATSIVFYRNAPDSTPLLLRGLPGQNGCRGILPRTTDLPVR